MHSQQLSVNLIIQYSLVGLVLLAAVAWIAWRFFHIRKDGYKSCGGCPLSQNCGKNSNLANGVSGRKNKDCDSCERRKSSSAGNCENCKMRN